MKYILIIVLVMVSMLSCIKHNVNDSRKDTPFMVVVKLLSAEQKLEYDEARKYIDVNQVYSKNPESENPEKEWQELLQFNYNLGKDPKFSNTLDFYKYTINETITKKHAVVSLIDENIDSSIKEIIYTLELRQNQWVVISIDYKKR